MEKGGQNYTVRTLVTVARKPGCEPWPRRLQPKSRRTPVLQKDSSMKTSREAKVDFRQAQYERR